MLQRKRCAAWAVLTLVLGTHCCTRALASSLAEDVDEALLPVDLTVTTFDGALQGLPEDRWALIEFFASWCPACQHFKPTYEKVSAALRREPLPQPEVWVARVDCATEVRPALGTLTQQQLSQSAVIMK
jgi:thiol-disulfide isomerase/thioredoxin